MAPLSQMPRRPPQRQLARSVLVPAPVGGINAMDAATAMPASDAFDLVNLIGGRAGLSSRLGFTEWCVGMGGNPVRSVVPFQGTLASKDRLFACSSAAIFDCTASTSTPTSVHTFASSSSDSGFGAFTIYVTSAGHFGLYCDEENGYLLYTESTDAWTTVAAGSGAGQINGATPSTFAHVAVWKNRVFFTQKNTAKAWYLPVGQITGTVTAIDFGNRFPHGGTLVGVFSATLDGGSGIDDLLVAISSSGDVLVYQGTDPAVADAFANIGTWHVGAVPKGRRIASEFGGDLLILSLAGIVPLSRLRTGTVVSPEMYATRKIQSLFNSYGTASRRDLYGWALYLSPEENCLLVNTPLVGSTYEQLGMSLATQGWAIFRERPSLCAAPWKGALYFGTTDGRLCKVTGDLDDVKLSGAATYDELDVSLLTAFSTLGRLARKQIHEIWPRMWTQGATPGYGVEARYDFDTSTIATTPSDPATEGVALWGTGLWGTAVWSGADTPVGALRGVAGMGFHAAIAFRARCNARLTIQGFDVRFTEGGIR